MDLKNLIIGLMFVTASGMVVLTFMFDIYGPDGYDVNLSDSPSTLPLYDLQSNLTKAKSSATNTSNTIWSKAAGQVNSTFASGSITDGDLMANSISSLTNIPAYLDVLVGLITLGFGMFGLGSASPITWFIIGSLSITVALILIGMVFNKALNG